MLTTLDHLVIAVRDLDAATATYARLLGRTPSWRGAHPHYGTANTLFRLDRTYAELLSPVGAGAVADGLNDHLQRHGEGPGDSQRAERGVQLPCQVRRALDPGSRR